MSSIDAISELKLLVRSHHGLIWIPSKDDDRVEKILQVLAIQMQVPYFKWTASKGLRKQGHETEIIGTKNPEVALNTIDTMPNPGLYHLHGMENYFDNRVIIQRLKDLAKKFSELEGAVIGSGPTVELPDGLAAWSVKFKVPQPSSSEYMTLLKNIAKDLQVRMSVKINMSKHDGTRLINALKGMTLLEAEKILTRVMVEDGVLDASDITKVVVAKKDIYGRDGLLEYYPAEEINHQIADLKSLRGWLEKRKKIIQHPKKAKDFGLEFPKGVLLLGVQGCGKSLCAKVVSKEWGLPLLRLDPSNLYNKYVGESEKNFKLAMDMAEKMAPVVLWIDEIEKAFAQSGGGDDGAATSKRILGTFLNWMQDRKGDVFIIATANGIENLPPEFLRKGRFDEIFFVDLPDPESRWAIFEIHLHRRKRDPRKFNLSELVKATEGFSGAEIEQAIVSSLYTAFSNESPLSTELLLNEIAQTRPLSQTMAEKITHLRNWAKNRTVSAH